MHNPSSPLVTTACGTLLGLLVAVALPATGAPVMKETILKDIETLSSDDFEGRAPGSNGEERTVAFLIDRFKVLGLKPGNPDGTYVQKVPMSGFKATPTLSVSSSAGVASFKFPEQFIASSYTGQADNRVTDSELVFVGYGVIAPEFGWDDYKGADLRGKTLVMLINDPPVPDKHHPGSLDPAIFGGKAMTYYGRWTYKYEIAAKLGAAAAIIIHETEPAAYPYSVLQNGGAAESFSLRTGGPNPDYPPIASWMQLDAAEAVLKSAGHSYAELKASALSRDFHPLPLGVKATLEVHDQIRSVDSRNVVARIEGSDPKLKAETIVYTAHWDHFGWDPSLPGGKHDQIYHGAYDNASGVATLLAIAGAFQTAPVKPKRSILFVVTTAEEQGLLGARYYAQHPLYPLATTLADINVDGAGVWGRTRDLEVVGMGKSTMDELFAKHAAAAGVIARPDSHPERGYLYRADQLEFARHGVPVLYVEPGIEVVGRAASYGEEQRNRFVEHDYHQVTDTVQPTWDTAGAADTAAILYAVGAELAAGAPYPTWKSGSEFKSLREAPAR